MNHHKSVRYEKSTNQIHSPPLLQLFQLFPFSLPFPPRSVCPMHSPGATLAFALRATIAWCVFGTPRRIDCGFIVPGIHVFAYLYMYIFIQVQVCIYNTYIHYKCQCQFQSPTSHWQQEDLMQASSFARVGKGKALTTAQTPISRTKSQGRTDRIREGRCSWHLVSRDMLLLVLLLSYYYPNFMVTHGNRSSLAKDRA